MSCKWDAVIIGSGIGGLTCGAFLARAGLKVKVLEKHYRIGGYAHSFNRGQFRFESGIHSAPLESNGYVRFLLRTLGIENKIETLAHPSMYTSIIGKDQWCMPSELNEIVETLCSSFPHERTNIHALFTDMEKLYSAIIGPLYQFEAKGNETNPEILKSYQSHTYQSYIESFIKDQQLQRIFFSQWPFCGITPECSSTAFFSLMYYVHAKEGSNYLKGGFETLAHALASVITENGGEVCTNQAVKKLIVENGEIQRVILETGEDVEGRVFVSNISPFVLVEQLLDSPYQNKLWIRRLNKLTCSTSAIAVYLGLDSDISSMLPQNILFWYKHGDFRKISERILNSDNNDDLDHLVVLKTPDASKNQTLFLMVYANYENDGDWSVIKEQVASKMIDSAEQIIPGLKKHIKSVVTASPLTFERYTANTKGSLYGFANTFDRYSEAKMPMQAYIPNLFQTGHWVRGGGVWNVMESGYSSSKIILKKLSVNNSLSNSFSHF